VIENCLALHNYFVVWFTFNNMTLQVCYTWLCS